MNLRTILSGITALLLVGAFYTFSFCIVNDVDETSISMDYYYATATEADDKAASTPVTSSDETAYMSITEKMKQNAANKVVYIHPSDEANTNNPVTDLPADVRVASSDEEPVSDASNSTQTDALEDDDDNSNNAWAGAYSQSDDDAEILEEDLSDDEGVFSAADQEVFAEDSPDPNKLLSRLDKETAATTVPLDLSDIPSVPVSEVTVTFVHTEAVTTVVSSKDIFAGETLTAKINGSSTTMDAYELVCLIVNNEISASFSPEAIKAQAVAAYSYVKYHNVNGLTPSVLVRQNVPQSIKDLVAEVFGVACYYNGSIAQTVYMASSSGYTASASNVWGGNVPYLTSVECPFDNNSDPNYGKTIQFSESDIKKVLEKSLGITLSDNPENWLKITEYCDGNYVSCLSVDGQANITGRKMRENVLGYKLKSASFDVTYSNGIFTFVTYGYGHGVGMSQNGANILAKQGFTYDQILKYYFKGTDVY